MPQVVKATIVRIGNSRGIRIPKPLLEQLGADNEVELEIRNGQLIVKPGRQPRANWEEAFKKFLASPGKEALDADPFVANQFDEEEWEW